MTLSSVMFHLFTESLFLNLLESGSLREKKVIDPITCFLQGFNMVPLLLCHNPAYSEFLLLSKEHI